MVGLVARTQPVSVSPWLATGAIVLGVISGAVANRSGRAERFSALALSTQIDSAGYARVRVTGLESEVWRRLQQRPLEEGEWEPLLSIRLEGSETAATGNYTVRSDGLELTSAFPLVPGLDYQVAADPRQLYAAAGFPPVTLPAAITTRLSIPAPVVTRRTVVSRIYPTSRVVPANLLKFYIEFSRPMGQGDAAAAVSLVDATGVVVPAAFLGLETELWDASHRRLTILLDPGRIKRGLRPNQELGSPLRAGHRYRLRIAAGWRDADGAQLREGYEKSFAAGPEDRMGLDRRDWRVDPPLEGTEEPLVITAPKPLDVALARRMITLRGPDGSKMGGRITFAAGERVIQMFPNRPWVRGPYSISVDPNLEDLAGNTLQRPFDTDLQEETDAIEDDLPALQFNVWIGPSGRPDSSHTPQAR